MNILQVKKYCHLIKTEQQNKLSLNILLQEMFLKNKKKKKQLKDKEKKQIEAAEVLKPEENKKYIKSVEGLL